MLYGQSRGGGGIPRKIAIIPEHLRGRDLFAALGESDQSLLLFFRDYGFVRFDGENWSSQPQNFAPHLSKSVINSFLKISDNRYAFGTVTDGLYITDSLANTIHHITIETGLQNNSILALFYDTLSQNLWVGQDRGLSVIKLGIPDEELRDPKGRLGTVYDLLLSGDTFYLATNVGLFTGEAVIVNGYLHSIRNITRSEFIKQQTWEIKKYNNILWCSNNNGSYTIRDGKTEKVSRGGGWVSRQYSDDYLIQGTYEGIDVFRYQEGNWKHYRNIPNMFNLHYLEIDSLGDIWVASKLRGVYHLKVKPDFLNIPIDYYAKIGEDQTIEDVHIGKIGRRTLFLNGENIYRFDNRYQQHVIDTLLSDRLGEYRKTTRILPVQKNHYWLILGNVMSLFYISPDLGKIENRYSVYFPMDISYDEFYVNYSSQLSTYLVGMPNGIRQIVIPTEKKTRYNSIIFRSVTLKNPRTGEIHTLKENQEGEVPSEYKTLKVIFACPEFLIGTHTFQTQLEGYDKDWSTPSDISQKEYTNLSPGSYRFRVKVAYHKQIQEKAISFTISSPWYLKTWMILLYCLLFLLICLSIVLLFRRQRRRYNKKMEEVLQRQTLEEKLLITSNELTKRVKEIAREHTIFRKLRQELKKYMELHPDTYPRRLFKYLLGMTYSGLSSEKREIISENIFISHRTYFQKLKQKCPALTRGDLRFCAYLRMGLSSKEIAVLLNISSSSVEVARYRIRKKLGLKRSDHLVEYLTQWDS